jgi:hypothetical protein
MVLNSNPFGASGKNPLHGFRQSSSSPVDGKSIALRGPATSTRSFLECHVLLYNPRMNPRVFLIAELMLHQSDF